MSTKQQLLALSAVVMTALVALIAYINTLPDAPTATIDVAPTTITVGQSATLTWSTTDATTVTLNGDPVASSGTQPVSPAEGTHVYTLVATGDGEATDDATLIVQAPPPPGGTVTTAQAGNWSATTTWVGGAVPTATDDVSVLHPVTVDQSVAIDSTLTVAATVVQANFTVTFGAGSELVFDCTAADRKWLQGTNWTQANCKIVCNGTSADHVTIRKIGPNSYWFDGGEEGTGAFGNCGGWECDYTDFKDAGHSANEWSIRSNDFGIHHRRFDHCTFDNCKTQFAVTFNWGINTSDWTYDYCKWINQPAGAVGARFVATGTTGTGEIAIRHCAVGEPADASSCITLGAQGCLIEGNYFDSCPSSTGAVWGGWTRNTIRQSANTQTLSPTISLSDTYLLADHTDPADRENGINHVGNPHFIMYVRSDGPTFDGLVFEYPHALLIDGGDGIFGQDGGSGGLGAATIKNCLVLPSMTDGVCGTNLHAMTGNDNGVKVLHNTVVGKTAILCFNERNLTGITSVAECKSNLVAGTGQGNGPPADWAVGAVDINGASVEQVDNIIGITNNYIFQPRIDDGSIPGAETGWWLRLSSPPDGTNLLDTATGPQFVDPTRNAAAWAVQKGAALPGDTKRVKLDAWRTLLMNDPTLGHSDLLPWVKAGFVTQNPALQNAGHDGQPIGAL